MNANGQVVLRLLETLFYDRRVGVGTTLAYCEFFAAKRDVGHLLIGGDARVGHTSCGVDERPYGFECRAPQTCCCYAINEFRHAIPPFQSFSALQYSEKLRRAFTVLGLASPLKPYDQLSIQKRTEPSNFPEAFIGRCRP